MSDSLRSRRLGEPAPLTVDAAPMNAGGRPLSSSSPPRIHAEDPLAASQYRLASALNDVETERRRNMKLHVIRSALQEDLKRAKEIGFMLKSEADRERERAMQAERQCSDLKAQLALVGGPAAAQARREEQQAQQQAQRIAMAMQQQLAASEDSRIRALMQLQSMQSQLGISSSASTDLTQECEQMQDELVTLREAKRKSEMEVLQLKEDLEIQSQELRVAQRETKNVQRRLAKTVQKMNQQAANFSNANAQVSALQEQMQQMQMQMQMQVQMQMQQGQKTSLWKEESRGRDDPPIVLDGGKKDRTRQQRNSPVRPPPKGKQKRLNGPRRKIVPRGTSAPSTALLNVLLVVLCTVVGRGAAAAVRLRLRSSAYRKDSREMTRQREGEPPKYLIGIKGTEHGGFITTSGDDAGSGIPVGDKHNYPYGAECFNVNDIILAGREKAGKKGGAITYHQGWDEATFCNVAVDQEKLVVSKNAEEWHKSCEKVFGEICRRQCYTVAALFDRIDFTTYPPNSEEGGADYYMSEEDCTKCLVTDECSQTPRTTFSARISRPLFGNREGRHVLLPEKKILVAAQTQRNKPYGD